MKNIIIIFISLFQIACNQQKNDINKSNDDFNFQPLFQKFKSGIDLKIVETRKQDYFKGNMSGCNSTFYEGVMGSKMYYLTNV